jgi:hypothetical protein
MGYETKKSINKGFLAIMCLEVAAFAILGVLNLFANSVLPQYLS